MLCYFINYYFLTKGLGLKHRQNSVEFLVNFQKLKISKNHMSIRWIGIFVFQMGYYIIMSFGFLVGFWETGTHLRTRDSCHVSTSGSGRDTYEPPDSNPIHGLLFFHSCTT